MSESTTNMTAPNYQCPRCAARGKTWKGADPACAFTPDGRFRTENWNCATMNALRDLAEERAVYNNDSYAAIVPVENHCEGFIVLEWYKRRGRTESAFWLAGNSITSLTLKFAELALSAPEYTTAFYDRPTP